MTTLNELNSVNSPYPFHPENAPPAPPLFIMRLFLDPPLFLDFTVLSWSIAVWKNGGIRKLEMVEAPDQPGHGRILYVDTSLITAIVVWPLPPRALKEED